MGVEEGGERERGGEGGRDRGKGGKRETDTKTHRAKRDGETHRFRP